MNADRKRLAREIYGAFAAGDRDAVERLLADDFAFHSPPDPELDRDGYFERCWPNHATIESFEFVRLIEEGMRSWSRTRARRPTAGGCATPRS